MLNQQSRYFPWVFLSVLAITHLFGVLDRVVISLLVEPIKADLGLTDTEISLLQGLAFTLGLVAMLIPMGILVDRFSRTRLLGAGVGLWSLMTGLCGMAGSFGSLFLARMGIAVGEACLHPTSYSLISDLFPKRRLGIALSIFQAGGTLGTGLSFVAGGIIIGAVSAQGAVHIPLLGVLQPWQLTFVLIAIPGFLVALIVSAMPHPERGKMHQIPMASDGGSWSALRAFYRRNFRVLACHHVAIGISAMVLLAAYSWIAPLYTRVYGWDAALIGVTSGTVVAIATPVGLLCGGLAGDYLMRYGAYLRLLVSAVSVACGGICGVFYPLLSDPWTSMLLYGGMTLFVTLPVGVGNAALQHVVPNPIRGRVASIFYLTTTVVQVFGPTSVALTADLFFPFDTGIRYATAIVIPTMLFAASVLYLVAIPPYRRLVRQVDEQEG